MAFLDIKDNSALLRLLGERVGVSSLLAVAVAGGITFALLFLMGSSVSSFEERAGSLPWLLASDTNPEERITIVSIDERSIAEVGPWPWSWGVIADLVDKINEAGAQLQIHDILYPPGERAFDDRLLVSLTDQQRSIVAQLPILQPQAEALQSGILTNPVTGISCSKEGRVGQFPEAINFIGSSDVLSPVPKGHIAPIIDSDGSVRKIPAIVCVDGMAFPALALAPFFQLVGSEPWRAESNAGSGILSPDQTLTFDSYPGLEVPLDSQGNMRVSFRQSPAAFRSISAVDILNGNFDETVLDNVLVLVGATAFGLDDVVPTPYSGYSPGVELQARLLSSVLDDQVPYAPSGRWFINLMVCLLLGLLGLTFASRRGRYAMLGLPVAAAISPVAAIGFHGLMLVNYGLWIGWVASALFGFLASAFLLIVEHARVRLERSRVVKNLTSYLPLEIAKSVAFESPSSLIQAERCDVTLLSADLRNFSAIGERRPPEESAAVLHYFFTKVSEVVERHGGTIHEYKGDNVLAVWDGDGSSPAFNALKAALEIETEINTSLNEAGIEGLEPLAVGIGIEQGPVLRGSLGPANRRAHTLCGETVSVALRIQEMTADLSYPILIGEVAARYLQDVSLKSLGHYMLPGLITAHVLSAPRALEKDNEANKAELTLLKGGLV
ncbi:MAG: CHASE2 domain-containing protein [Pseudohongiellaceae bacterium]